ncbi:PAS domain-containing protein [Granulicella sp. L60]|uniref:PAS domain-containing protein n=1 Tax=Granulicella sp. L60 TaxID=1641866 RepID=UPI00131E2DD6|nr:PAS domain-containing protein [Granulicella sp. L60]
MPDSSIDNAFNSSEQRTPARAEAETSHTRSANLLAHLPEAILCFDRNWTITYANAEAARISRLQPRDIGSKIHWELFPETLGTDVEDCYRAVMQTRVPQRIEHFYKPFGLWVDIHVLPTDEGIAVYYRDITDRKQAEALRNQADRRFQQIFDASPDSIVCIDRNWICTFANRAALAILKTDTLVGENLWERFPSNQQEPFRSNYLATMERRVPTEFEAYYPAPLDIWFKVLVRPHEDGIVIFSSDVTDRKGAELLRDASARHLSQVLEITTDAVVSLNRDWNYTFLNRRAKELLSPRRDLLGKNLWREFPAALQSPEILFHYHRAMDQRIPAEFEIFYPEPLNLWLAQQCRPYDGGVVIFFRDVTARRQSDLVLKQQQNLLAAVQHTAQVATWDIDYATGKATFGAGSYPVFGHPFAEIPDFRAFKNIVVPEYIPIIAACAQAAIESGQMIVQEFQVRAADGSILWLESRGQAVFVDGEPTSLRGMTIDINSRKKNEEALVASEARYRVLADLNPQAIWMGAPDGSITYANQGFLDYIGHTVEELGGMGWLDAFHPDDHNRLMERWSHSVATGSVFDIEARMIRAHDSHARWWWLRAQAVRDDSGRVLHWLGVALDIDDRKTFAETLQRRQEETERQRAELETVYRTAPVGLGLFDPVDFRYLRLNDRLAEIIGLPPEEIIGRPITDIAPSGVREIFEQVLATKTMQRHLIEGEFPSRPGEKHFFNLNYSPVFAPDGSIQAIATATLDITHQKKAEAALIQSEKLAAVGRLASSISHEINNPLEAITNLLFLINLSDELPETVRQYVQTAQAELSRVCQIATQTLRFHRQAVGATRVTARDLVDAVLNLYQGRLANSNIRVEASYAAVTTILCFENDIRQVLNNLIANAIDAMRHGGRLLIRAHDATDLSPAFPAPRRGIRITIADTGHGMSPAVQARLFEPFFTTKDLNGTGLGLWISSGIINRHQGRLTLRSSQHPVHHGTIFSLFLPLAETHTPETHPPPPTKHHPLPSPLA